MTQVAAKFSSYLALIRFDRPIGTYLLLWPTLWALWLAADGLPPLHLLAIFCVGTFLMRSAGCALNDLADRDLDGAVARTRNRPLVTGAVRPAEAAVLALTLALAAFILVLFTNPMTIALSLVGIALAACYPHAKRHTHLPQVVLGAAFSWGIPMAFAAVQGALPPALWLIYAANLLWTVAYDTQYAMVDRQDDLKVGIKSTAILFGKMDRLAVAVLQALALLTLALVGLGDFAGPGGLGDFAGPGGLEDLGGLEGRGGMGAAYYAGLVVAAVLFLHQQRLIRERDPAGCFRAFLNNNYVGMAVLAGIVIDLW